MPTKIDQKIVAVTVQGKATEPEQPKKQDRVKMKREYVLSGETYKIKTPQSEHALYVTINDMEINGNLTPREIFLNSKCMANFAWIAALTRVMSAVFRQCDDPAFLVEELRSVFDPLGGYFKPGGGKNSHKPSIIAEIGDCLEIHLRGLGIMPIEEIVALPGNVPLEKKGSQCPTCSAMAVHILDGCATCTECGYSKCG